MCEIGVFFQAVPNAYVFQDVTGSKGDGADAAVKIFRGCFCQIGAVDNRYAEAGTG